MERPFYAKCSVVNEDRERGKELDEKAKFFVFDEQFKEGELEWKLMKNEDRMRMKSSELKDCKNVLRSNHHVKEMFRSYYQKNYKKN